MMKKLMITTAVLAGLGLAGAPIASADEAMYLTEVRQEVAYPLTDAQAIELGHIACGALRDGIISGLTFGLARDKADDAVGIAQENMGLSMSWPDAMFLVEAAEHQLC